MKTIKIAAVVNVTPRQMLILKALVKTDMSTAELRARLNVKAAFNYLKRLQAHGLVDEWTNAGDGGSIWVATTAGKAVAKKSK